MWQVNGRSSTSWDDDVRLDLYDVDNWLLAPDLAIRTQTVPAVSPVEGHPDPMRFVRGASPLVVHGT